jgi:hypothetical protein
MLPSALAQEPRSRRQLLARRRWSKLASRVESVDTREASFCCPLWTGRVGGGRVAAGPVRPVWARVSSTSDCSESVYVLLALALDRTTLLNSHVDRVHVVGALVVGMHYVRPQ